MNLWNDPNIWSRDVLVTITAYLAVVEMYLFNHIIKVFTFILLKGIIERKSMINPTRHYNILLEFLMEHEAEAVNAEAS